MGHAESGNINDKSALRDRVGHAELGNINLHSGSGTVWDMQSRETSSEDVAGQLPVYHLIGYYTGTY